MTDNIITSVDQTASDMFGGGANVSNNHPKIYASTPSPTSDPVSMTKSKSYHSTHIPTLLHSDGESSNSSNSTNSTSSSLLTPMSMTKSKSCPSLFPEECREFVAFAGEWVDSKGQQVLISDYGVIRYPNNAKLRFEGVFLGPNIVGVTFDKDPQKRQFIGTLNHDCELLAWSNGTQWARKGSKHEPAEFGQPDGKSFLAPRKSANTQQNNGGNNNNNANNANNTNGSPANNTNGNARKRRNTSCLVM